MECEFFVNTIRKNDINSVIKNVEITIHNLNFVVNYMWCFFACFFGTPDKELEMRNSKVIKALMLVTQLGISMMVPIFLCVLAGGFIDKKAGTGWVMPVFLFLGIAAAFRNVYYLLKPFYATDKAKEDAELAYIERLKAEGRQAAEKRSAEQQQPKKQS